MTVITNCYGSDSNHASGVYKEHYAYSAMYQKSSILLAGTD